MIYRGLIVHESIKGGYLPELLVSMVTRRYPHALSGKMQVEIVEVEVPHNLLPQVTLMLADLLLERRYYCHFLGGRQMLVIFPGCVCVINQDDPESIIRCRRIGTLFDIPESQMYFEEMFYHDHPDDF